MARCFYPTKVSSKTEEIQIAEVCSCNAFQSRS